MKPDQHLYNTRLGGRTVTVRKVEIEQDPNHRHHGKWVVRNMETGRKLHRSSRQLHRVFSDER